MVDLEDSVEFWLTFVRAPVVAVAATDATSPFSFWLWLLLLLSLSGYCLLPPRRTR